MMKKFKWLFQFVGLSPVGITIKALINFAIVGCLIWLFILVKNAFYDAWETISIKEPRTALKISNQYQSILDLKDSLKTAQNQVILVNSESLKKDSIINNLTNENIIFKKNQNELQALILSQRNIIEKYRKENRVCYKIGLFGKETEIECPKKE